jgi:pSer/pThr/pTyr-binding forkhead associated (FHA) protein
MTPGQDCPACGFENPLGANFCSSCGAALTAVAEHRTEAIEPTLVDAIGDPSELPPGLGMLIVRQGSKRGSRMALDADVVTVGRHPDSDIFLDDITVSRRHAEIRSTETGHEVRDLGSLNGTYVNQERVDASPLTDGDELRVGKFKLVYVALGDEADHDR